MSDSEYGLTWASLLGQWRATVDQRTSDDAIGAQNPPTTTLHLHDLVCTGDIMKCLAVDITTSGPDV